MATNPEFIRYVCDQIRGAGAISFRKMFGEYAVYCNGKVVALVCDNQFFLKPTAAGRALIDNVLEAPAYPGSKPYYLLTDELEDPSTAAELVRATERQLPAPKPKAKKPRTVRPGS
jgi:TfoX/Sxy family transcriptional regulator of competence genes